MTDHYTTAPAAETCAEVRLVLKRYAAKIRSLRAHGRYALSLDLKPEARPVIEEAIAYCAKLADEFGEHTLFGCCGSPAGWANGFRLDLGYVID